MSKKNNDIHYITNIRCKISSIINSIRLLRKELPININLSFAEIYEMYKTYSSDISSIQLERLKEAKQKCSEIFCNKLLDNKSLTKVLEDNNGNELMLIYNMLNENYVIERLFNLLKDNTERLYEIFDIVHQEKYNDIDYIADIRIDISALMLLIDKELPNNIKLSFREIYEIYKNYSKWDISSIQPQILKEAKQKCIEIFCNKLLDNKSLGNVLQAEITNKHFWVKINNMLQNDDVIQYLSNLLVQKNDIKDILQLVTENNNDNKYIVDIKDTIKKCISFAQRIKEVKAKLPEINDLYNNIFNNINTINQNNDIDDLFDYLLDKDLLGLECILEYGDNKILSALATILQNPEVQKNLRIARVKFIQRLVQKYSVKQKNMGVFLKMIIDGRNGDYNLQNNDDKIQFETNVYQLLFDQKYKNYTTDIQENVINDYRDKLINAYKGSETAKTLEVINSLIHKDLEEYANDICFAYEGYQMLNELFKNQNDKFTFDNFSNVVQGNGTKEQIEKINRLLSRQLIQYYIYDHSMGKDCIKNCIERLEEIENKMYSDILDGNENLNSIKILSIVKQCFEERAALIEEHLKKWIIKKKQI